MSAHTPGPWSWHGDELLANSFILATRSASRPSASNAILIAAAPDLLEALQALLPDAEANHCGGPDTGARIAAARAAIAKAVAA